MEMIYEADTEMIYEKEFYRDCIKFCKKDYEETRNPICLMSAFTCAVEHGLSIPTWVRNRLHEVFSAYLKGQGDSLDKLLGCVRGPGQAPAREDSERKSRDAELMMAVDVLTRNGMRPSDAAKVAVEYCRELELSPPNPSKVRDMYYQWKLRLAKITEYPACDLPDILKAAPESIRKNKRYANLFKSEICILKYPI